MGSGVRITDHAVIRYAERHYGFNFERLRSEMNTPMLQAAAKAGANCLKWNGGKLVIRGGSVVTYIVGRGGRK